MNDCPRQNPAYRLTPTLFRFICQYVMCSLWFAVLFKVELDRILLKIPAYYREIIANLMFYIRFVRYRIVLSVYVGFIRLAFLCFPFLFADFS